MTLAPLPTAPAARKSPRHLRLTVDQYHAMIKGGILPEGTPCELIDGQILRKDRSAAGDDPFAVGSRHATAVSRLSDLSPRLKRFGCFMRVQQPLTLPPFDEPEPDGAIVFGRIEDYAEGHPTARQVLCVIEVADSSLHFDRTVKQGIYAASRIPHYAIVNLVDSVIELHSAPMPRKGVYDHSARIMPHQAVVLPTRAEKMVRIPARQLLP